MRHVWIWRWSIGGVWTGIVVRGWIRCMGHRVCPLGMREARGVLRHIVGVEWRGRVRRRSTAKWWAVRI